MVWRAKWGETKLEKYPYRPNTGQKVSGHTDMITTLTHQPDYARRAAAGWAQHQSDQAHRQAVLRDPGYQKWQQARGSAIEDDEDWYPKEDWNSSQNNHFGYLYSKDPWEARNYATLVNRENRWGKEIGSQQVRTGMPKKPNFLDRAADFLTDAWNRNAEAESVNSGLAMEQGLKTGEKARKVFDSAGQAMAAQSEMNRQGADGAAKEIKEQTKKAAKHWGDANAAYSEAQTEQANKTGEFAERTKQHWANANKSYSEAHNEHAQRIGEQAAEASRKYGEMWALTSGVTGSDQTGASIHGYRNTKGHAVSHEASKQTAETIRKQIADGGIDVLGHAIAARGLSGGKTLDSYNKVLEYSATGKISKDNTVTPGRYTEIVDEAVADYLTKQYGNKAGNVYNKVTGTFDQIASFAILGPEISLIKDSIDLSGSTMDESRANGSSDREAVEKGFLRGMHNAGKELLVGKTIGLAVKKSPDDQVKELFEGQKGEVLKDTAGAAVSALIGDESVTAELEAQKQRWKKEGYSEKQAERIAMAEIMKQKGKNVLYNAGLSAAQRSFYEALRASMR